MKKILLTTLISCCFNFLYSQTNFLPNFSGYEDTNLGLGYHLNFKDSENPKNYYLINLDLNKSYYNSGKYGVGGFQFGVGTELGINTKEFLIGGKLSGILYLSMFCFGTELITYTNFDDWTLRLSPIIGIGSPKLRLTISPHYTITNKNYQPINKGYVSAVYSFKLKSIKKEAN